mmetsp:Transcript_50516/g.133102  ORF Transcript_50516/g.133102 Transcript_50516/m.133102 type:complete len:82 (+) Transcript_50516:1192-1437(+)
MLVNLDFSHDINQTELSMVGCKLQLGYLQADDVGTKAVMFDEHPTCQRLDLDGRCSQMTAAERRSCVSEARHAWQAACPWW